MVLSTVGGGSSGGLDVDVPTTGTGNELLTVVQDRPIRFKRGDGYSSYN